MPTIDDLIYEPIRRSISAEEEAEFPRDVEYYRRLLDEMWTAESDGDDHICQCGCCQRPLVRKRYSNGQLEPMRYFLQRRYCCIEHKMAHDLRPDWFVRPHHGG